MEKKWDTVIPVDLKGLFVSGIYVPLVTKGLNHLINLISQINIAQNSVCELNFVVSAAINCFVF